MYDRFSRVSVKWWDHCSRKQNVWHPIEVADCELLQCHTIGFVIAENQTAITVACTLLVDERGRVTAFSGDQTIGKSLIISAKVVSAKRGGGLRQVRPAEDLSMQTPSADQLAFLERHKVPIDAVFDATGLTNRQWRQIMKESNFLLAYGVSPCKASGHTLRTRYGHCVQCKPAYLQFIKRYSLEQWVYVMYSESSGLSKVGTAWIATRRLDDLNKGCLGGSSDWELKYQAVVENAGRVENMAHQALNEFRVAAEYMRGTQLLSSQEVFACSPDVAISALKEAVASSVSC